MMANSRSCLRHCQEANVTFCWYQLKSSPRAAWQVEMKNKKMVNRRVVRASVIRCKLTMNLQLSYFQKICRHVRTFGFVVRFVSLSTCNKEMFECLSTTAASSRWLVFRLSLLLYLFISLSLQQQPWQRNFSDNQNSLSSSLYIPLRTNESSTHHLVKTYSTVFPYATSTQNHFVQGITYCTTFSTP